MKRILLVVLFAVAVSVSACKKHSETPCTETNKGTISFTPDERLIHPYQLGDSLVFYNTELNNTLTFTCNHQGSCYQNLSENQPDNTDYSGCLGNYYKTETFSTSFANLQDEKYICFSEHGSNPFDTLNREKCLLVTIGIPGNPMYEFNGVYAFRTDTLFLYPNSPISHQGAYHDTMTIGTKLYHKVYQLECTKNPNVENLPTVYYTVQDGILGFTTSDDHSWILQGKYSRHK